MKMLGMVARGRVLILCVCSGGEGGGSFEKSVRSLVCLRSHVLRAYCTFESKRANPITLFGRPPNNKQLTFGATVSFNDCQTSNVWRQNTTCLAPC